MINLTALFQIINTTIDRLKEAMKMRSSKHVAIMLDTKGPEIRTGANAGGNPIQLFRGNPLDIITDFSHAGTNEKIACSYKELPMAAQVGGTICIDDGKLTCVIKQILENGVRVEVMNDYELGEKKTLNLPRCNLELPILTEKDEEDITEFVVRKDCVDFIAASCVRKAEDID